MDIEDIAKEWGKRHPNFIRPDSDLLKPKKEVVTKMETASTKRYLCGFCPREFEREQAMRVHQSQCKQNPNGKDWQRFKRTKATREQKVEAIPHKVGGGTNNVAETVLVMWNKYLGDADETKNINQLSRDFLKKLINGEIL